MFLQSVFCSLGFSCKQPNCTKPYMVSHYGIKPLVFTQQQNFVFREKHVLCQGGPNQYKMKDDVIIKQFS